MRAGVRFEWWFWFCRGSFDKHKTRGVGFDRRNTYGKKQLGCWIAQSSRNKDTQQGRKHSLALVHEHGAEVADDVDDAKDQA